MNSLDRWDKEFEVETGVRPADVFVQRYKYDPPEITVSLRPERTSRGDWITGLSVYYCFDGDLERLLYEATGVRWRHTGTFMDHSAFVTDEQPPEEFEVTIPWTEPSAEWVALVNRSRGKIVKSRTRGKTRYIIRGGYTGGVVGRFDTEAEARAYIDKAKAALEEVV